MPDVQGRVGRREDLRRRPDVHALRPSHNVAQFYHLRVCVHHGVHTEMAAGLRSVREAPPRNAM
jgi:hypothetical protein